MFSKHNFFAFLATLTVLSSNGYAQVLTLQESLSSAYTANPTLQAARESAASARHTASSRWGNLLPNLSAEGYWGGTRYDANGQTDTIHPRGVGVTLSQPLFTGGELMYAARAAAANAQAAEADASSTAQTTLLSTVQAYTGVLVAQAQVSATQTLLDSLTRQADAAAARYKAGEGTTTDLALTTARRETASGNFALAQANLVSAREDLARYAATPVSASLTWPQAPTMPQFISATALAHPAVQAATARTRAAEASQKSIRGALIPDINATATASQAEDTSLARTSGSQMAYQVRLSVPLFAGFSKFNDNRAAHATARAADDTLRDIQAQVRAAQATAMPTLAAARASANAAEAALAAQQKYYDSISKTYSYGESSLLDLLDAAQARANAEADLATARANYILQAYTTLAAYGQLTQPPTTP